jgi:hypothetical protein
MRTGRPSEVQDLITPHPPVSFSLPAERRDFPGKERLMIITQQDIARLSDDTIRRMVLELMDGRSAADPGAVRCFSVRFAAALVRALKERHRLETVADLDLLEDEAEGSLVEPGTDPVAAAAAELRRDAGGSAAGPI